MGQRDHEREDMAARIRALMDEADRRGEFHVAAHLNEALIALTGQGQHPASD